MIRLPGCWKALLAGILFLAALYGLLHYASHPVTLRVGLFAGSAWDVPAGDSYAIADAVIEKFERENPGIHVKYVSGIQKTDYPEWLAEQMVKGEEPDVFLILPEDFELYASMGALMEIKPWIRTDAQFRPELYYSAALSYGQYEGQQAALPVESMPTLMFVNKSLLAESGIPMPKNDWTWADFLEICRRVTKDRDGDGRLDQFGCYDFYWKHAADTNGVQLFRPDGRASYFASPQMEETLRFLMDLHELGGGQEVTSKDFDMGKVAFRPFTFAEYRTYKPYPWRIKKYTGFEWDCIKFPAGPSGRHTSSLGTLLAGISARTQHRELAWKLLKMFCYDREIQQLVLKKSQGLPVRRDVLESEETAQILAQDAAYDGQMDAQGISKVMDEAIEPPKFKQYQSVMLIADNEIKKIVNGTVPYNNALNKLQKEINAYLQY